jgi:hypothetical protein
MMRYTSFGPVDLDSRKLEKPAYDVGLEEFLVLFIAEAALEGNDPSNDFIWDRVERTVITLRRHVADRFGSPSYTEAYLDACARDRYRVRTRLLRAQAREEAAA